MLLPSIFRENLFDDFMDDFRFPEFNDADKALHGKNARNLMKTDVRDKEDSYEVDIDLPGFKKDEITMHLEDGYLTVSAAKGLDKDERNEVGTYVRRERYAGSMSRSFFVGDQITEDDIHPKYENGILTFSVPKKEHTKLHRLTENDTSAICTTMTPKRKCMYTDTSTATILLAKH